MRGRNSVCWPLGCDGEGISAAAAAGLQLGEGRKGSQLVINKHNWSFIWKRRVQADGSPWLGSVTEHLMNFSLGLLPGFSVELPHFCQAQAGVHTDFQGHYTHIVLIPYPGLQG